MTTQRLRGFGATIFAEMTQLAARHEAVNLGQGFPDWDGPPGMLQAACDAIRAGINQYPPGRGFSGLREAICEDRRRRYGIVHDPETEAVVTTGATEAISAAMLGLVEPGSEVILVEPYYDAYAAAVALAGARRVSVSLVPEGNGKGFRLDLDPLRAAVTTRTAMIVINSPHNPTGTVFTADELLGVVTLAAERDLLVLADEVYERLVFDAAHVPLASLPGAQGRVVTVSSAAKTFNVTGWKVGWALAAPPLADAVLAAKQFLTFASGAPFQVAVEHALRHEQAWVEALREALRGKRDRIATALVEAGLDPFECEGTYFVCARAGASAEEFCRDLPARRGVAAIPVTAFTDRPGPWHDVVRFAFCKTDPVLDEGISRLASAPLVESLGPGGRVS